ncbi:PQQ-dependent dehydrogenase, methanol/ethanol family [Ideonella sp. B7]|uniref:PQQ-dependent dehydrogenase, methanol/ethanol family n=1 Tax=Ideonella benzenivorans TaxID=2831643 RepID=UPI001CEC9970|nr:PQQ-dependent dehydrogenase, methanol/ethanol family [Ideonella benzenivorans]MCA6215643.1 PQQ-dependent dehydrogenase, methanol/ethanol family [Ideonella benzenivorans]
MNTFLQPARRGLALVLAASLAAPTLARLPADVNGARIVHANQEPGNWMSHGRTYDEQRYSPLTQVNDRNVQQLGVAWTQKLDWDFGVEATPIVVDGVMYTTGAYSIVYAYDARTGQPLWKYDPEVPRDKGGEGCCSVVNRGVAVWEGKVYVGAFDGRLIALDARNGKPVWSVDTRLDKAKSYTITGAPRIVHGKVLIGNGGAEFGVRGYITAYDAKTGKQAWRFFTVPGDPAKPPEDEAMAMALRTWYGNGWVKWGGGGTVWDSMAYDPELNLLYIGVGNGSPFNYKFRSDGKGDNLFLSSIVALDADTGKYRWHYQTTPAEMWDYTATQHIILAELEIEGKKRKVLMQAPKNGFFYVLDRSNGQLLSAEKFVPVNWASHIDMSSGRPVKTGAADYLDGKGMKIVVPSFLGGHNWQPMSFHPGTGLVYLPAQETAAGLEPQQEPMFMPIRNVVNIGLDVPQLPEDPKVVKQIAESWKGRLLAWDPVAQKARWSVEYPTAWNGGTLATAGNLVFQGTADGRAVAYAADTGKLLWQAPVNSGAMAGPVTYTVGGEQYVTFMVGWGGSFPNITGPLSLNAKVKPESRVVTFKLGGSAQLPPPRHEAAVLPPLPPLKASEAELKIGRTMFNGLCANCHGLNAVSGGVVPDLRYLSPEKHGYFLGIVYGGRTERGMPSFAKGIGPEQVELIRQYIISRSHALKAELAAAAASAPAP